MSAWCEQCKSFVAAKRKCHWCDTPLPRGTRIPVMSADTQFATLAVLVLNVMEPKEASDDE